LICSIHNFKETPHDLDALLKSLKIHPAAIYKIACMANSSLDALRMLCFIQKQSKIGSRFIGICMGEDGTPTRILGNIYGNVFTYAAIDAQHCVALGQLDIETLINTFHFDRHNKDTIPFGVIGNPISRSVGHIKHNTSFRKLGVNAVYVRMRIPSEDLAESMKLFPTLNFGGLSVTMPLKEAAMLYVNTYDPATKLIGALNTIVLRSKTMKAYNTDGEAAVNAIRNKTALKDKRVIILGAGGAAKAILYYLHQAGAQLVILNRSLEKAEELARKFSGKFGTLNDFPKFASQDYDILINSTSVGRESDECPVSISDILPEKIVMEVISTPAETLLIKEAKNRNCTVVYGQEMYENQAEKQLELWVAK
jgi:3-dehydroquinate dehydratase/shikimate dehydrogenase